MPSSPIALGQDAQSTPRWFNPAYLPLIILCGAAANGFFVRVMESVRLNGTDTILFGISPFELIVVFIAGYFMVNAAERETYGPGWPDLVALALIVVPSSAVSWMAVTGYAAYIAYQSTPDGDRRRAALLFVALGLAALWSSIVFKWFAAPITAFEAHITAGLLMLLRPDITVSSNLMGVVGGHQVLLLPACASAYLIPKALIAFAALVMFVGSPLSHRQLVKVALFTVLILALGNLVRLAIMTWSHDLYDLGHGPIGANIFDLFQTATIVAAGMWASK